MIPVQLIQASSAHVHKSLTLGHCYVVGVRLHERAFTRTHLFRSSRLRSLALFTGARQGHSRAREQKRHRTDEKASLEASSGQSYVLAWFDKGEMVTLHRSLAVFFGGGSAIQLS